MGIENHQLDDDILDGIKSKALINNDHKKTPERQEKFQKSKEKAENELITDGITEDQESGYNKLASKRIYNLVRPRRYAPESVKEALRNGNPQKGRTVLSDHQDKIYREIRDLDLHLYTGEISKEEYDIRTLEIVDEIGGPEYSFIVETSQSTHRGRDDMWGMYLGLPQKYDTFAISEYQPSNSKENIYYYSMPKYEDMLFEHITHYLSNTINRKIQVAESEIDRLLLNEPYEIKDIQRNCDNNEMYNLLLKGMNLDKEESNLNSDYSDMTHRRKEFYGKEKWQDYSLEDYKCEYMANKKDNLVDERKKAKLKWENECTNQKVNFERDEYADVMGNFRGGIKQDENCNWYVYYYDKIDFDPIQGGKIVSIANNKHVGVGKSYEIYNRMYFDPEKNERI